MLRAYFEDLSKADVMAPEAEAEAAAEVAALEMQLWRAIFARPEFHGEIAAAMLEVAPRQLDVSFLRAAAPFGDLDTLAKQLRAVDDGKLLAAALQVALRAPVLGPYRPRVAQARDQRNHARNRFVEANLRLVISIARHFNHGRLPLADLIQEGNLGLICAVSRYDVARGYRFSTYATFWIRHAIGRALADKGRAIRLPVTVITAQYRLGRVERQLAHELGRDPSDEELAAALKTDVDRLRALRVWCREDHVQLDHPVKGGTRNSGIYMSAVVDRTWGDVIADAPAPEPEPGEAPDTDHARTMQVVRELLPMLKPIEADVLRRRFNIDGAGELTFKEIGRRHDLSRERVRQIQGEALLKLRAALLKRGIS